jgi:hypothetical protein
MANPIEDFLMAKEALGPMGPFARRLGGKMLESGATGLAYAGMGAGVAGIAQAAQHLYSAATKKRDFDSMLVQNPHLIPIHQQNPEEFGQMYTSLRAMNPEFARDPLVAGSSMWAAMEKNPQDRGAVAVQARRDAGRGSPPGPLSSAFMGGYQSGSKVNLGGADKAEHPPRHSPESNIESEAAY